MSNTNATLEKSIVELTEAPKMPDFGKSRYSDEMTRIFTGCVALFGVSPDKAEKIARIAAADAGNALKNARAEIKVGKANSDGKATISDASKLKGVTLTPALSVVRALQWANDAGKNGVSYSHTKWQFIPVLNEWIEGLKP